MECFLKRMLLQIQQIKALKYHLNSFNVEELIEMENLIKEKIDGLNQDINYYHFLIDFSHHLN